MPQRSFAAFTSNSAPAVQCCGEGFDEARQLVLVHESRSFGGVKPAEGPLTLFPPPLQVPLDYQGVDVDAAGDERIV